MSKKRVIWVDIAKFICIMCVMNSHLESAKAYSHSYFTPFYLTLFFFCSGYVYRAGNSFPVFFRKKVAQLLIPWLIFSVGNILLSQILTFNEKAPLGQALLWNFLQIRGKDDGVWFVSALFMTFLPFFFFIRWYEKKPGEHRAWMLLVIAFLLSCLGDFYSMRMDPQFFAWGSVNLPWHLEYIFFGMFYMVLGYLFRNHWETVFDKWNTAGFCAMVWIVYCALILNRLHWHIPIPNLLPSFLEEYFRQCLGITAVISVCKKLPENRFVTYIGQNTLLCFALHGKVYSLLQTLCRKMIPDIYGAILRNNLLSGLFAVSLTIVLAVILIVPIWIINRWFPFLVGRRCRT